MVGLERQRNNHTLAATSRRRWHRAKKQSSLAEQSLGEASEWSARFDHQDHARRRPPIVSGYRIMESDVTDRLPGQYELLVNPKELDSAESRTVPPTPIIN